MSGRKVVLVFFLSTALFIWFFSFTVSGNSEKEKGNAAFRAGDYARALTHYDKAIQDAGNAAGAALFSNKAAALHHLEDYDGCIQQCVKGLAALDLTPEMKSKLYLRMGNASDARLRYHEQLEVYKKCDSADPAKLLKLADSVSKIIGSKSEGVNFWISACCDLLLQAGSTGADTTSIMSLLDRLTLEKPDWLLSSCADGGKASRSELIAEHNQFTRLFKQIFPNGGDELQRKFSSAISADSSRICKAKPSDLKPVYTFSALHLDEVNVGKMLVCRTITEPVTLSSLVTLVEDAAGEVRRLSVYVDRDSFLPSGAYHAVLEPWYKTGAADGQPLLQAGHSANLRHLPQSHSLVQNRVWRTEAPASSPDSWESLQKRGNEYFVAGKFRLAFSTYGEAIELKRQVAPQALADLFSNRAAAYLGAEMPTDAYWDCQSALFIEPEHLKATYRLAKAQGRLGKYEEARDVLVKSPHTTRPEFQAEISRLDRLIREQRNGDYDIKSLLKEAAKSKTPHLDHADYNGGVEVQWISRARGNGLVATRDFEPGDLLFVNKAFEATYKWECNKEGRGVAAGHVSINSPARMECTSRIYDRVHENSELWKPDEAVMPVDGYRLAAIVTHNSIGFTDIDESDGGNATFEAVHSGFQFHGCGVWLLASFMNHSCVPNTVVYFFGDLMFVRARTSIRKGEEMTISYVATGADLKQRQQCHRINHDFVCDCELCTSDLKRAKQQPCLEAQREAFMASFEVKLANWIASGFKPLAKTLEDNRKLAEDFAKRLAYKDRYDAHLRKIYTPLAIGFSMQRSWIKAAKTFELAYATAVGKGTQLDVPFVRDPLTREELYLCFSAAHNYSLGSDYAKAKEYFGKMLQAAKICYGSAEQELLEALYPELSITKLFNSMRRK